MVHVNFDPDSVNWENFFSTQEGSGFYFEGVPYQRGYGVGAIFASLARFLLPIAKTVGAEIGREGLALGHRVLGNLSKGENLKESLKKESHIGLKNLVDRAYENNQTGQGRKIFKKIIKKKPASIKGREAKNKLIKKSDFFGTY